LPDEAKPGDARAGGRSPRSSSEFAKADEVHRRTRTRAVTGPQARDH
jgi:hypothetical protein